MMGVDAEKNAKLSALRAAAQVSVDALYRGEFKAFENIDELKTYLVELSERIISESFD